MVNILTQRREEIEHPQALLLVQESGVLLKLAGGIYAVFLRVFLYFRNIVGMFCSIFAVAVSAETVYTSQRIFEEEPLFFLALHIAGIVALYVGNPLPVLFYPDIVIRWLDRTAYLLGDNGVLHRYGIYGSGIHMIHQYHFLLFVGGPIPHVCLALHHAGGSCVIGKEFRRIIGYGLHLRLPGEEIVFQKIGSRIRESVHTGTYHGEGEFLLAAFAANLVKCRHKGFHDVRLSIRFTTVLYLKAEQRKDDILDG